MKMLSTMKSILLAVSSNPSTPTETLAQLTGPGRREVKLAPLSPEALEARKPRPPEELVGALQDRVHVEKGKLLSATPIRRKRQE